MTGISEPRPSQRAVAENVPFRIWPAALIALLIVGAALALAVFNANRASRAREAAQAWERHTYEVLLEGQRLLSALEDAETGERGFLLVGDPSYLEPYERGKAAARTELTALRQSTSDNPAQQANLDRISAIVDQRLGLLASTVELARTGQRDQAVDVVRQGRGKALMDAARLEVASAMAEEQRLLVERRGIAESAARDSRFYVWLLSAFGVFTALVAAWAGLSWLRADGQLRVLEATRDFNLRLAESEDRARRAAALVAAIGESTPDLLYAKDRDGKLLYANPSTLALIGKPAEDVLGRTDRDWASNRAEGEAIVATDQRIMASGKTEVVEERFTDPEGRTRVYRSNKSPLRGPDGAVTGLAGITVDITEARAAEDVLRASEERFRTLSNTLPAFIFLTDAQGQNTYTNSFFQQFTGMSADELLGSGWVATLHADDRDRARTVWDNAWQSGQSYSAEYRFHHHADGYRWHLVRATPVRDDDGRVLQWVGTALDLQELIDARDQLSAHNEDLEERVRARTIALQTTLATLETEATQRHMAEAQVRQMQKMESVGQLTGGIAHDFNNMLAIVIGSLELVRRRLGTDPQRALVGIGHAEEGARRAAQLTARLLAFSRQQPLTPERLDLNRLVGSMSEMLRRTIGEHVRVETVLAGGLWPTYADAAQLESAILNLCVNARDAMPDGGKLTIETSNGHLDDAYVVRNPDATPGQYAVIGITDTGVGMSAEVIERAFDPFYTTKGVGKGTGLGLSQVHGYVKQSGGHVKIYSEADQGTTVRIYLPRYFGSAAEAERSKIVVNDVPQARDGETILLVEDEAAVREMAAEALRDLGYTVLVAADANQALEALALQPGVSLLFTDIVMPDMNGRRLAEEALKRRPDIKVLYTTGYTRNAVVHNGVLDPGVALLPKPFTLDALARKVRAVLDGEGANSPPPGPVN